MGKYIITDRRCGLGDALLNLAATYLLAQEYGRDVIIDWRRLPYTLCEPDSWRRHHLNVFRSVFQRPRPLNGVNFLFPEEVGELFLGYKTQEGYPFDLDNLPDLMTTDADILLRSSETYIRSPLRIGEYTVPESFGPFFKRLEPLNTPALRFRDFLSHLKPIPLITARINCFVEKFLKEATVAIHYRHGNGEDIMGRGSNWIGHRRAVKEIEEEARDLLGSAWKDYVFLLCSDAPEGEVLLKRAFPRHCVLSKDLPPQEEGSIHFAEGLNPIQSIQDSFIDMALMARCSHLLFTDQSTFSLWAQQTIPLERQRPLFRLGA